ncbi:MAG: serine hydrolase [Myxococcota bacterium]
MLALIGMLARAQDPFATVLDGRTDDLVAVVVEQHGSIVWQHRERDGVTRGSRRRADPALHDIRSAGKSLTALAVGAAIADGKLGSVDVPVWPMLGAVLEPDDRRADITVRDLLTMSSGLDCDDGRRTPGNEERMYRRRVWRDFALRIPPTKIDTRGTFAYCTAGVFLLGQVVQDAVGEPFDAYVQRRILGPLGIERAVWRRSRSGEVQSGGQLELAPEDLAKLGRMVLDHGTWSGEEVVPRAWISEMLTPRPIGPGVSYGYLWWFRGFRTPDGPTGGAYMSGNGGNLVVLLPEHDAVVVVQSAAYNEPDAHQRSFELVEAVLAALPRP